MRPWALVGCVAIASAAVVNAEAVTPAPAVQCPTAPPAFNLDEFECVETVPDAELASYRGGFEWQGVQIGLGVEIRTFLNGVQVLQTNISWTADGAHMTQVVHGPLTAADSSQLQAGILSSGGITMRVGDQSVYLANQGQTAIVHRTDGSFQNILINRASNISARQEIDASLDLQNFGQFQTNIMNSRAGGSIGDMVGDLTLGAFGD